MQSLSAFQLQAFSEFKRYVQLLERDDDHTCLRFLRARNYDVAKSVDMYNGYKKWRLENNVDNILNEISPLNGQQWPHSFHGVDKAGRPIFIERIGVVDVKQLIERDHFDLHTLVRSHIRKQEYLCALHGQCSRREGKVIETTVTILDLEGCGMHKHLNGLAREYFSAVADIGQNYYPERMEKILVINVPRSFSMAWSFVRALLDPTTQHKIEVLSSSQTKQRMMELIDPHFLPKYMGGMCDCEAKGCFVANLPFHIPSCNAPNIMRVNLKENETQTKVLPQAVVLAAGI